MRSLGTSGLFVSFAKELNREFSGREQGNCHQEQGRRLELSALPRDRCVGQSWPRLL
jgi:hypothetical protein